MATRVLTLFALFCIVYAQLDVVTINVAPITAAHPQFGNAVRLNSQGLTVNGNQGAELRLSPGMTYKLVAAQPCTFPMYISTTQNGGADFATSGVLPGAASGISLRSAAGLSLANLSATYAQICNNAFILFSPLSSDVGKTFYYQATTAPAMGWKISIVGTENFITNIKLMTPAHPQFPNPLRISTGYTINNIEGASLTLSLGKTYRFNVTGLCSHPLYISEDQNGGGADFTNNPIIPGTHGISLFSPTGAPLPNVRDSYLQVCGGAILQWTPQAADLGKTFFYQCAYHFGMGWNVTIVQQTFCEKYAKPSALGQTIFMDAVMTAIIGNIVRDPLLLPFFDSSQAQFTSPQCCLIDFLSSAPDFIRLKTDLMAFFGGFLGCTEQGFPKYTGSTDMKKIHALMPIATAEFNRFNSIVKSTILSLGVTAADFAPLGAFLDSTRVDICNSGDCRTSICDRYSDALKASIPTSEALVRFVVNATVFAVVAPNSPIKQYFDGTKPAGSVNFLAAANSARLQTLQDHLVQFFGMRGVLQCTDPLFPTYRGVADMKVVHAAMGISGAEFDFFNQALLGVMKAAGVSAVDLSAVLGILETTRPAIVSNVAAPPAGSIAKTFTLTVATKNASHPNNGLGFPQGFYTDSPIVLQYKSTYKFIYGGSCSHPFYITSDNIGGGGSEINAGVDRSIDYSLVCGAAGLNPGLLVSIDDNFCAQVNGQPIFYNCRVHARMGGPITVNGCPPSKGTTFCERYANTLGFTQVATVTAVVDGVVPRLVAPTSPVLKYFNGTRPSGSIDFTTNVAALTNLKAHLVQFFGQKGVLGCTDPTFPAYVGNPDMGAVHKLMGISPSEFDFFNQQILAVMGSVGVTQIDQANVLSVLETTRPAIVGTFCARYAGALGVSQETLVSVVVDGVVGKLVGAGSNLTKYFNGQRPSGSVNFLTNVPALTTLKAHLVQFFGQTGVLSCNDPAFPAYAGNADMRAVHYPMGISASEFDEFNQAILSTMTEKGVSAADTAVVLSVLETTRGAIVQTFCQRYAVTLGVPQVALVRTVVNLTIPKLVASTSPVAKYFDGTKPAGSVNFLTNPAALSALFDKLVSFFGQNGVLSCDDPAYPPYTGNTNMGAVHSQMGISNSEFDFFNQQIITTMTAAGVVAADTSAVLAVLETTRSGIVVAQGPPPPAATFCQKYATALTVSQQQLLSIVVDEVVARLVGDTNVNKKYFDGTKPAGSLNFLAPTSAARLTALKASLVAFFGQTGVLGCTEAGFPAYTGAALGPVHQPMGINRAEFDSFNRDILFVLNAKGVAQADQTAVLAVLDSTASAVVAGGSTPPAPAPAPAPTGTGATIVCSKYAKALNLSQYALLATVVNQTVQKLVAPENINKMYFDGTKPVGSTNFLTNPTRLSGLMESLIRFFGQQNILGCNETGFPAYQGRDMASAHRGMNISKGEFDAFNADLIGVLASAGVTLEDRTAVLRTLESTQSDIVSGGNSGNGPNNASNNNAIYIGVGAGVGAAILIAIIVLVICCRGNGNAKPGERNYVAF